MFAAAWIWERLRFGAGCAVFNKSLSFDPSRYYFPNYFEDWLWRFYFPNSFPKSSLTSWARMWLDNLVDDNDIGPCLDLGKIENHLQSHPESRSASQRF